MEDKRVFDNWDEVRDCNKCEPYWLNQCDGAPQGSEQRCSAYRVIRVVDIPGQINDLRKSVKWLSASVILLSVAHIIHVIGALFSG